MRSDRFESRRRHRGAVARASAFDEVRGELVEKGSEGHGGLDWPLTMAVTGNRADRVEAKRRTKITNKTANVRAPLVGASTSHGSPQGPRGQGTPS